MSDSLEPFKFFQNESSHDEIIVRANAMKHVVHVVSLMDAAVVRVEMLPFLQTRLTDHDQILTILAGKLWEFVPFLGGAEHAAALIPLLEPLCSSEESYVRNAAAESVSNILRNISTGSTSSSSAGPFEPPFETIMVFMALIRRLTSPEGNDVFYPRYTAAICTPALYFAVKKCEGMSVPFVEGATPLPSNQETPQEADGDGKTAESPAAYESVGAVGTDIIAAFSALQVDEISIVRNACCSCFIKMVDAMEPEGVSSNMLGVLRTFLKDDCPPIRLRAIEQIHEYTSKLKDLGYGNINSSETLPMVRSCVEDGSWKVRLAIAKNFGAFLSAYDSDEVSSEIFPLSMVLLKDTEPEVRQAVLTQLLPAVDIVGAETFLKSFLPIANSLTDDPIPQVRKLLATESVGVAVKTAGADSISDLISKLMNDEDPMIRIRILKQLHLMAESVPALCTQMSTTLKDMFSDSNWRVRQEMIRAMPAIITHLGVDFFEQEFVNEFLGMLRDSVDEVRNSVALTFRDVVPLVGMEWAYEKIFQAVRPMSNADFLLRLSMLSALQGLLQADLPPGETFQSECLALVVAATNDRVPNVRMKAAQVLSNACYLVGPDISRNHIRPVLNDLQGDADRDVAYFATEGMKLCT